MKVYFLAFFAFCFTTCGIFSDVQGLYLKGGKNSFFEKDKNGEAVVYLSDDAIVDWEEFSLAKGEKIRFVFEGNKGKVLNRVSGEKQTEILGFIESNGEVFFSNEKGFFIGETAEIKVESFFAGSFAVTDESFFEGEGIFSEKPSEGNLYQYGTIFCPQGKVCLLGNELEQSGTIQALSGEVYLLGNEVRLTEKSKINVSGEQNAGKVCIGGDFKKQNAKIVKAAKTYVAKGAEIIADSYASHEGGCVMAWANDEMEFYGTVLARAEQGTGGKVEISSRGSWKYNGAIDVKSSSGLAGEIIWDPKSVVIQSGGTDSATGETFNSNSSGAVTIDPAALVTALESGNVTIQANTDITFSDAVVVSSGAFGLTLQAGRSIIFGSESSLILNGGAFQATINDQGAISEDRDAGVAQFFMSQDVLIQTGGGNCIVAVGTFGTEQVGMVNLNGATIDTSGASLSLPGGDINLSGYSPSTSEGTKQYGIALNSTTIKTDQSGTITCLGVAGSGIGNNAGFVSSGSTKVITVDGEISLTGTGGDGDGNNNFGLWIYGGEVSSSGSGDITLVGTGGTAVDTNSGIVCSGSDVKIQTVDGSITLTGTANGGGDSNEGIRFEGGACLTTTNTGVISLTGSGGYGSKGCHGIIFSGANSGIISANGDVTINGSNHGYGTFNVGVRLEDGGIVMSQGIAEISIVGMGGDGTKQNHGISFSGEGTCVCSSEGNISLQGTGQGNNSLNQGIRLESGGKIISTGSNSDSGLLGLDIAANITMVGNGGDGTSDDNGIAVVGDSEITSVDGNIHITGNGNGTGPENKGVVIEYPNSVRATGSGTVTVVSHPTS